MEVIVKYTADKGYSWDKAENFHIFSVDVRGQGKSSRTPGHYSYNICGYDLKLFLQNVIKEPAIVSGLSSGAVLTVWLAANAPEYVDAIISVKYSKYSTLKHSRIRESPMVI